VPRPGGLTPALSSKHWIAAAASGGLLGLAFPTPDLGWMAWIALVPLLVAIRSVSVPDAFRLGYVAGLIAFGIIMHWISLFGVPAWVALAAGMAAFLGAFAAGARWLAGRYGPDRSDTWLWAVPLTWMAVEVIRSTGPIAFPWAQLGLTQYRSPVVLPVASLIGVIGVGGFVAAVNALIAHVAAARRISAPWFGAACLALILVGAGHFGLQPAASTRILAVVQPNADPREREPGADQRYRARLANLTEDAFRRSPDLIAYPESALSEDEAEELAGALASFRSSGAPTQVQGVALDGPRNGAVVFHPDATTAGEYIKRRPVPFGEAGLATGGPASPIATRAGRIAIVICYESAFSELLRPLVAGGGDVIAILTNDGWFGTSAGPAQHAAHAVLRAVEMGRSVARAANTGISMLIRPDGVVVASSPLGVEAVLVAAMPVPVGRTPFVQWGWLIAPAAVVGWIVAAAPATSTFLGRRKTNTRVAAAALIGPGLLWMAARILEGRYLLGAAFIYGVMIAACWVVARSSLFSRPGFPASLLASTAITVAWVVAMRVAYAQFGLDLRLVPSSADAGRVVLALLAGFATEMWLRGALFDSALRLAGGPAALIITTIVGVALQYDRPQEIVFWHMFSGAIFGAIRLRTGDAVGLGPARAFGDTVLQALARIR
jgi:apolipoprotein N-acyltransferase